MGVRAGGMLRKAGAVSILTAGVTLFTIGMLPVQAAARHTKSAPTAPSCAHQPNLNDPTNSTAKVLDSYWFVIEHGGQTTTVCTLFGNVSSGDIVTAHFTLDAGGIDRYRDHACEQHRVEQHHQAKPVRLRELQRRGRPRLRRGSVPCLDDASADGSRSQLRLPGGSHLWRAARDDEHRRLPRPAPLDRWSGRQPLDRLHAANTDSDPDSHGVCLAGDLVAHAGRGCPGHHNSGHRKWRSAGSVHGPRADRSRHRRDRAELASLAFASNPVAASSAMGWSGGSA